MCVCVCVCVCVLQSEDGSKEGADHSQEKTKASGKVCKGGREIMCVCVLCTYIIIMSKKIALCFQKKCHFVTLHKVLV